ncbi:DENN domain-containing protein 2C isoform 2-T2 [Pholidichthys leucotaenia]
MLALRLEQGRRGVGDVDRLQKEAAVVAWQGRPSARNPSLKQCTNIKEKISQWEGRSQQQDGGQVKEHPPIMSQALSAELVGNGWSNEAKASPRKAKSMDLEFKESPKQSGINGRKSEPVQKSSMEFTQTSPEIKTLPTNIFTPTKIEANTTKHTPEQDYTTYGNQKNGCILDVEALCKTLPPSTDEQDDNLPPGNFYTSRGFWRKLEGDRLPWEKGRESLSDSFPPPKPQRTFQYQGANNNNSSSRQSMVSWDNSSPQNNHSRTRSRRTTRPPNFPPPPCPVAKTEGLSRHKKSRKSFEYEDAVHLTAERGTPGDEARLSRIYHAYSDDDIYEDIVCEVTRDNPYEDVKLSAMCLPVGKPQGPKYVNKIETIFDDKRGRKRVKNQGVSVREEASGTESDPEDAAKGSRRSVYVQSTLKRRPGYRTLERDLIQLQQQQLFQIFVVVSLRKSFQGNTYSPEITQQFPKMFEKSSRLSKEAEDQLKVIPKFCFPDVEDWKPSAHMPSETFSFVLTGEDGSRWFCYCRKILPSGKGKRLPEVHCIVSKLGCFNLFAKILEEVERRRDISPPLVYPFMRAVMEAPFPAPGRTVTVKSFLPGSGNEVLTLCRPVDSRLEHVDFDSLLECLSVTKLLQVFASLLLERRVVFIADKLSVLSRCSHAALALLYPFTWQHTFIPVLPVSMLDISCSPTPFLIGVLAPCLPQLLELPIEEVLIVDLCADRFVVQLGDEDCILPSKLQAALQQVLEEREEILREERGNPSGGPPADLSSLVSEGFVRFFVELVGHYSLHMSETASGGKELQRDGFRKSHPSRGVRQFLQLFMDTQMFAGFIQDKELRKGGGRSRGLFEVRVSEYLDSYPDLGISGVNRFFKGLGNKMKLLNIK